MADLHPTLLERVNKVLAAMAALGFPMRICQGVRTLEQQQALYAQGRTMPGPIVTNCDGVVKKSNHQVGPDGYGRAADLAFIGSDPFLAKDSQGAAKWAAMGACAVAVGLLWGGNFRSLVDRPHVELPQGK